MHLYIHMQIKYISPPLIIEDSTLEVVYHATNRRDVKKMGKEIYRKLKKEEIGAIGIGAMIVFIAMVLVAGIAASVLIQTSTKLETQAMASGQETIAEVSSGIAVTQVQAKYDGTNGLDYVAVHIRARAGSRDIDLSETVVEISDSATKDLLVYNTGSDRFDDTSDIGGDIFTGGNAFTNADGTHFGIIVLEDADDSISNTNPVLNKGDHVIIAIDVSDGGCFNHLGTRTDVFGMIIPEEGSPGVISFTTPESYNSNEPVVELQ